MKFLLHTFIALALTLTSVGGVQAQATPTAPVTTTTSSQKVVPPVSEVFGSGNGAILGESTILQDYSGVDNFSRTTADGTQAGAYQFRNIISTLINFIERMMVPLAIVFLLWSALSLLISRGDEAQFTQRIRQLVWTGAGFLLFAFSFTIVDYMFFGVEGQIFTGNNLEAFGAIARKEVFGIVAFASSFVVAIATLYLVFGALQYIILGEQEEQQSKIRRQIVFTVIGILIIASANMIAVVFFGGEAREGLSVDSSLLIRQIIYWANLILGFIGMAAVIAIIWAGVQMILHFGNEESVNKSKKIIMYAIIGLILAFSAFTIVRFFLTPGTYGDVEISPASQLNEFDRITPQP